MVIGAYGKVGRLVVKDAVEAGMDVTAVAHKKHSDVKLATNNIVIKNAMDMDAKDVSNFDVIVDAIGGWNKQTAHLIPDVLGKVVRLLAGSKTRYIKVGGANTLYINRDHSQQLQELSSYYPTRFKFLCDAHKKALDLLRTYSNIAWTYVTPPFNFVSNGANTGEYRVFGEEFKANFHGDDGHNDYISYADFANGIVDIIKNNLYLRQRVALVHGDMPTNKK
ncbi:NAD(P)-dependent oxidoreductase [Companilactobacillus halodurans]|nr:NAD(P)H-binding protein [Companilactobacillus halodurans]